jgi:hypothetical protein
MPENLDLRQKPPKQTVSFEELPSHSERWAEIIKIFAILVFVIAIGVIFSPFIILWCAADYKDVLDWAKIVLSPVVGFVASVIGYYFGTRNSGTGKGS